MDPTRPESHKRKKSAIARSLLHGSLSKPETKTSSDIVYTDSSHSSSSAAISSATKGLHSQHSDHNTGQNLVVNVPSNPTEVLPNQSSSHDIAGSPTFMNSRSSLEQSVRLFRLFEALRHGDKSAISKAMKDTYSGTDRAGPHSDETSKPSDGLEGTSVLHLAVQCGDVNTLRYILELSDNGVDSLVDVNARDKDGNTPLHLAANLGRTTVVKMLLEQEGVLSTISNFYGQTPLDNARNPGIYQQLQLSQSLFQEATVQKFHELIASRDYDKLEEFLAEPDVMNAIDVNGLELATETTTVSTGGTLLHEAARRKDTALIQMLLLNGADPFKRDRKGKLPQDVTKDDRTRAILKRSPAAVAAQRGIQERTILGSSNSQATLGLSANEGPLGSKVSREIKGYLKKWTNYTSGYKLRWFVLEDGVLSYYKHQDDAGSACRGAINMKIAKLYMDPHDKLRFEIQGKSSVKYHLKANHQVEAKRWFWALNNAIQWGKEEAKQEEKRHNLENEAMKQAKLEVLERSQSKEGDSHSLLSSHNGGKALAPPSTFTAASMNSRTALDSTVDEDEEEEGAYSTYAPSIVGEDHKHFSSGQARSGFNIDVNEEDDYGANESSRDGRSNSKDAFNIIAQSANIQLDLIHKLASGLRSEQKKNPEAKISDPIIAQTLSSYESAVANLKGFIGDMLRISRDRDAYWQYRLNREINMRRIWEDSMTHVAKEQEELENKIGESESKRKRTKKALKEALDSQQPASESGTDRIAENSLMLDSQRKKENGLPPILLTSSNGMASTRTNPKLNDLDLISESESDNDEEFFDAVNSGNVEVISDIPKTTLEEETDKIEDAVTTWEHKKAELQPSFCGYEDAPRTNLALSIDKRPKVSLWGILKSMVGQDMTKITLPAAFNEPTSLLQRIAEDMEYCDLLNTAASRTDSMERMVYVAAFAASEYASTIGRVAKPFNPLLGETYEYARPDKGFRFFIEQVSHHPPIGACYAESPKWDYFGESNVRSKFSGRSFDINHLGTWYLRLRSATSGSELYTWKKATSSVVGIITGNPTVDHYGAMEIKNWSTGEVAIVEFKPRGWKASSAYQVSGKVLDKDGKPCWSIGGHWNSKLYARLTPGYEAPVVPPKRAESGTAAGSNQAILIWEANERPSGIPFNLTPFVLTLNALPDKLRPQLAPTDTRLRPDQRAMEDGEYDLAASEKVRLEEDQRARRREREERGESYKPRWFKPVKSSVTGEQYWEFSGEYWKVRENVANGVTKWDSLENIF